MRYLRLNKVRLMERLRKEMQRELSCLHVMEVELDAEAKPIYMCWYCTNDLPHPQQ